MDSIDSHIAQLQSAIERAQSRGNQHQASHLEQQLADLQIYRAKHPGEQKDPTPLEVYCELHPQAPECLVYDD
ncbi:MAG: hypothetical protein EBZ51_12290 [Synechococcaceae bacterium WB9_2_112]|nr:hypothetical protein [Synechococcaceae bacterium WB9_2_112]